MVFWFLLYQSEASLILINLWSCRSWNPSISEDRQAMINQGWWESIKTIPGFVIFRHAISSSPDMQFPVNFGSAVSSVHVKSQIPSVGFLIWLLRNQAVILILQKPDNLTLSFSARLKFSPMKLVRYFNGTIQRKAFVFRSHREDNSHPGNSFGSWCRNQISLTSNH